MNNTIVYLLGYQGVGKLTIGRQIAALSHAVLLDNHLFANPVFMAVANDTKGGIPEAVKLKVERIRSAVFDAIAEDAPKALSYVLTDVLMDDDVGQRRYHAVEQLVSRRDARFVPVLLNCEDDEEYARRVTDPGREKLLKQTDLNRSLERRATRRLLPFENANAFSIEVSGLSARNAAMAILKHLEGMTE